jgi:hypothetical protein
VLYLFPAKNVSFCLFLPPIASGTNGWTQTLDLAMMGASVLPLCSHHLPRSVSYGEKSFVNFASVEEIFCRKTLKNLMETLANLIKDFTPVS